jgi:hypothetical protein
VVLCTIHQICQYYHIREGSIQTFCNNKAALRHVFHTRLQGVSPFLLLDYDLVQSCHHILSLLPFNVTGTWVKGHYTGKDKCTQHILNEKADILATQHNQIHNGALRSSHLFLPIPGFQIRLLYDGSVITSKLYQVITNEAHTANIQKHIQRKTPLTPTQFNNIHWSAHGRVFRHLTQFNQLSTSKLLDQLVHTNRQCHLMYAGSAACPS